MIRIAMIGDIVGRPGRKILKEKLPWLIDEYHLDAVIANGENAAGGFGITPEIAEDLFNVVSMSLLPATTSGTRRKLNPTLKSSLVFYGRQTIQWAMLAGGM